MCRVRRTMVNKMKTKVKVQTNHFVLWVRLNNLKDIRFRASLDDIFYAKLQIVFVGKVENWKLNIDDLMEIRAYQLTEKWDKLLTELKLLCGYKWNDVLWWWSVFCLTGQGIILDHWLIWESTEYLMDVQIYFLLHLIW